MQSADLIFKFGVACDLSMHLFFFFSDTLFTNIHARKRTNNILIAMFFSKIETFGEIHLKIQFDFSILFYRVNNRVSFFSRKYNFI